MEHRKKIYRINEDWDAYFSLVGDTREAERAIFDSIKRGECYSFWELGMYVQNEIESYSETSRKCLNVSCCPEDMKENEIMLTYRTSFDRSGFLLTDKGIYVKDTKGNITFTQMERCFVSEVKNGDECIGMMISRAAVSVLGIESKERCRFVELIRHAVEIMKQINEYRNK